jgi:hypothetical protein
MLAPVRDHSLKETKAKFCPYTCYTSVAVATRSKAQFCGRSPAEIVGSNSAGDMDGCLSVVGVV